MLNSVEEKIYVEGKLFPDVKVPMKKINLLKRYKISSNAAYNMGFYDFFSSNKDDNIALAYN